MEEKKRKIVIIVGPTAVGKTEYAIEVAKAFDGEIVSADSMQLYRFMDIGSAKPTKEEQAQAKHYLVDEIDPRDKFSVAAYQKKAKEYIDIIFDKGKLPIVSGGTGLYVNSLIYQMDFSDVPPKDGFRQKMKILAEERGDNSLYKLLQKKDPAASERIHPNNHKKIIRALEALEDGHQGIRPFENSFRKTLDYDYLLIGLNRPREELYRRINLRVDTLIQQGLIEEVQTLRAMGLCADDISMKGIGYKEIIAYLEGECSMEIAVDKVKQNSRNYAKRQMTWFRRYPDIKWFDIGEDKEHNLKELFIFIRDNF